MRKAETLYVRLVNEPVDMWRPVEGVAINVPLYGIAGAQQVPDDEQWEFVPGEIVAVVAREFEGRIQMRAVSAEQRSPL